MMLQDENVEAHKKNYNYNPMRIIYVYQGGFFFI